MDESRTPSETRPPRMDRLARLPVFYALDGKRAIVAGGNAGAAWKAELLSAAGATVEVFVSEMGEEMRAVAGEAPNGAISLHARNWQEADLDGAAMAVGAFEDEAEAGRFAAAARSRGVPVNVVDKPAFCDFAFGSIVNRSPLVIGISTDGAAPIFGQAIRAKLEALIPVGFAHWADAAKNWRRAVQTSGLSFAGCRRFWQLFTARAVTNPNQNPGGADFELLLAKTRGEGTSVDRGSVTLVGAGPGDPEFLTLRAVRALQSADVILIDDLVSPEVLDFARREAKKMLVGKTGHGPSCKQQDINRLMVSLAKSGKRVVRLKGGDPLIFARADEELEACRAADVPCEIVPGISAAQGAAARLGIPLTGRGLARRVQYVTGHDRDGGLPSGLDWQALADPTATTIVYMPVKTLAELSVRLIENGLPASTPAAAIARATRHDEEIVLATLGDLHARLAATPLLSPVLVLIGRVLSNRAEAGTSNCDLEGGVNRARMDAAGFG
jgi:uroporphyrin-III C-methyltransferase / precorrin-2 dehydrogenase / sirohydrochlorin ferrochelatase